MKLVIALGGNAILQRKEPLEASIQRKNINNAASKIAILAKSHNVVVTHGNGPQVGLLALQNDAYKAVPPYPLDILDAETEGMIGYLLLQSLKNCLPTHEVVAMLTQTQVDKDDPAFQNPTKFVGPVYTKEQADEIAKANNWMTKQDGDYYRRVVPSPMPIGIIEQPTIAQLSDFKNTLVICAGGGGMPVYYNSDNQLVGVDAVVDKDNASNVLAQALNANSLIILTDVPAIEVNFGKPDAKKIKTATPEQLAQFNFPAGSMGPKVGAVTDFVKKTGQKAMIGALDDLSDILDGKAGTHIVPNCSSIEYY